MSEDDCGVRVHYADGSIAFFFGLPFGIAGRFRCARLCWCIADVFCSLAVEEKQVETCLWAGKIGLRRGDGREMCGLRALLACATAIDVLYFYKRRQMREKAFIQNTIVDSDHVSNITRVGHVHSSNLLTCQLAIAAPHTQQGNHAIFRAC